MKRFLAPFVLLDGSHSLIFAQSLLIIDEYLGSHLYNIQVPSTVSSSDYSFFCNLFYFSTDIFTIISQDCQ